MKKCKGHQVRAPWRVQAGCTWVITGIRRKRKGEGQMGMLVKILMEVQLLVMIRSTLAIASLVGNKINLAGHDQQFFLMRQNKKYVTTLNLVRVNTVCETWFRCMYICIGSSHKMYFSYKSGFKKKKLPQDTTARFSLS